MLDQDGAAVDSYHKASKQHTVVTVSYHEALHHSLLTKFDARIVAISIQALLSNSSKSLDAIW